MITAQTSRLGSFAGNDGGGRGRGCPHLRQRGTLSCSLTHSIQLTFEHHHQLGALAAHASGCDESLSIANREPSGVLVMSSDMRTSSTKRSLRS